MQQSNNVCGVNECSINLLKVTTGSDRYETQNYTHSFIHSGTKLIRPASPMLFLPCMMTLSMSLNLSKAFTKATPENFNRLSDRGAILEFW